MQFKRPIHSCIGSVIQSNQKHQKYQVLQKINKNQQKIITSQINKSTFFTHTDTFIVKRQSNKLYYIMKRFQILFSSTLLGSQKMNYNVKQPNTNIKSLQAFNLILAQILKQLKTKILFHPNLLNIQDIFFSKLQISNQAKNSQKISVFFHIVQQYCQEGDLAYFIKREYKKHFTKLVKVKSPSSGTNKIVSTNNKKLFDQKLVSKWLLQILLGLQVLHFNKFNHLDLKLKNIYLTPSGNLKINENYLLNILNSMVFNYEANRTKDGSSANNSNSNLAKKTGVNKLDRNQNEYQFLEGYQYMFNEKKFRLNQKKDILDFGLIISLICNFRKVESPRKQQSKNYKPTLLSYSTQLNKIFEDCINNKKTGVTVPNILKTPYFLQTMREFIIQKKLNVDSIDRIPIKKYTIHKKNKQNAQITQEKNQLTHKNQDISDKQRKKLPKIQKITFQDKNNKKQTPKSSSRRNNSKNKLQNIIKQKQDLIFQEKTEFEQKKIIRKSLQKLKNKLQNHKQKLSNQSKSREKQRENSKQKLKKYHPQVLSSRNEQNKKQAIVNKQKIKALTPIVAAKKNPLLPPPPSLQKNQNSISKSAMDSPIQYQNKSQRKKSQQHSDKQTHNERFLQKQVKFDDRLKSQQKIVKVQKTQKQDRKQYILTPEITFGKNVDGLQKIIKIQQNIESEIKKQNWVNFDAKQLQTPSPRNFKKLSPQKKQVVEKKQEQIQKIQQSLAKIFSDLKIRQDDDQQLSFQLNQQQTQQQESQLRLTLKLQKQLISSEQGNNNLMKTYKNKFEQIIFELQQKYQPNMETIIQKTNEWDSNDFFANRQLLKRLRLEDGESILPYSLNNSHLKTNIIGQQNNQNIIPQQISQNQSNMKNNHAVQERMQTNKLQTI